MQRTHANHGRPTVSGWDRWAAAAFNLSYSVKNPFVESGSDPLVHILHARRGAKAGVMGQEVEILMTMLSVWHG